MCLLFATAPLYIDGRIIRVTFTVTTASDLCTTPPGGHLDVLLMRLVIQKLTVRMRDSYIILRPIGSLTLLCKGRMRLHRQSQGQASSPSEFSYQKADWPSHRSTCSKPELQIMSNLAVAMPDYQCFFHYQKWVSTTPSGQRGAKTQQDGGE